MTFSIVARCAETGRLGVGVTTASLAVGGRCPFVRAGAGAVTTQNRTHPSIGPRVLDLLETGASAEAAVAAAVEGFPFLEWRQVAAVDARGGIGVHHGQRCSGLHAEARGEGVVALGNLLATTEVPAAMLRAFERAEGMLEDRILAALSAGLTAGGEVKPLQSAALLVADRDPFPYTNLRVDLDETPLDRLGALWRRWRPAAETCRAWALDPYGV